MKDGHQLLEDDITADDEVEPERTKLNKINLSEEVNDQKYGYTKSESNDSKY